MSGPRPTTVVYGANAEKIGGGNRVLMDLILHLDRARYRPIVVSPALGPLTDWAAGANIEHHVCRPGDWQGAAGLARRTAALLPILLRERAGIVHASAPTCYRALGVAGQLIRAIRVCHLGFPPHPGELARSFVAAPHAVIGCYEGQAADHADEIHGMAAACRVVGICNGIDTGRFRTSSSAEAAATLRTGADQVVGILGHLSDVKGHPAFVEAAATVSRRFPGARFVAIGGETVQEGMRGRLEARARELGIGDRIQFLGFRKDVAELLSAVDVVVLPSLAEGFPLAVLEAMACGKPVVATPVGGVPEAVVDGVTGLLVPPQDPDALAGAIGRLLDDAALRGQMGRAARQRVLERFSVQRFAGAVQAVYAHFLNRRSVGRSAAA